MYIIGVYLNQSLMLSHKAQQAELLMPSYPFSRKEKSHIEIVQNTAKCHYDSVVPVSKSTCLSKPVIRRDVIDTIVLS